MRHGSRPRPPADHRQQLHSAWTSASKRVTAEPALTAVEITATIAAVEEFVADPDVSMLTADRDVLAVACRTARRHGTTRPALPRREVQAATGLSWRQVDNALDRLTDVGLLELAVPGRPGATAARRRASLYRLPDACALFQYRGTRSMAHHVQVYGPPLDNPSGPPVQVDGPPTPAEEGSPMLTITRADGSTWTMREDMLERVLAAWPAAITPAADDSPLAAVRHLRAVEAETQPDVVGAAAGLGS